MYLTSFSEANVYLSGLMLLSLAASYFTWDLQMQLATNSVASINDSAFNLYHINFVQGRLAFNVLIPILPIFALHSLVSGTPRS